MSFKDALYHQVVSSKVYELIHKYLALSVAQLCFARKFCRIFFFLMLGHFSRCQSVSECLLYCCHNNRQNCFHALAYLGWCSPLQNSIHNLSGPSVLLNSHPHSNEVCLLPLVRAGCGNRPPPPLRLHPHHALPKDTVCLLDLFWHQKQKSKESP